MTVQEPQAFFVYGTLMQGQENFGACAADALSIRPGATAGTLYHLAAGFPVLVDTRAGRVRGQIMTFPNPSRTLAVFDELEGFDPSCSRESLYVRIARRIDVLDGGDPVFCWLYVAAPSRMSAIAPYATFVPGGDWAAYLRGGVHTA